MNTNTRVSPEASEDIRLALEPLKGRERSAMVNRLATRYRVSRITINAHARRTGTKVVGGGDVVPTVNETPIKRLILQDEIDKWSSPVSKADLLIMQSQIAGLAYECEKNVTLLRELAHGIDIVLKHVDDDTFAERILEENRQMHNIVSEHLYRINNLESELDTRRERRMMESNRQTHSTE